MHTGGAPNQTLARTLGMANHAAAAGERHGSGRLVRVVRVWARARVRVRARVRARARVRVRLAGTSRASTPSSKGGFTPKP